MRTKNVKKNTQKPEDLLVPFFMGESFTAYEYFGAHKLKKSRSSGYVFRTYAPKAKSVELIGDFSDWQGVQMQRDNKGVFSLSVDNAQNGQMYKYRITSDYGKTLNKCDPYCFQMEIPPKTASIITDLDNYRFQDNEWMNERDATFDKPMNIYELHFGSWRRKSDGSVFSYTEMLDELIPYLKNTGFTHIEILPLNEHPFDGSWGYQPSNFFSVTARYGTPEQFMEFVDKCHQNGIGVIMDFVAVHFVRDDFALLNYDGHPLYEYDYEDVANSEWGSRNFNVGRNEVKSFLKSAANFWLTKYHVDGLRIDAVNNLIYWQGNPKRHENKNGLTFIKELTSGLKKANKGVMLMAEDSSNFVNVTAPVENGGLGFDYKWDMGWMNDTLKYFKIPPAERTHHHNMITFSMWYFYSERFLLPLSHDEVVHGKATIMQKMWGDYEDKFKQCKTLFLYMLTHPGKKLNFMGNEIGQFREWDEKREQDWLLLKYPKHDSFFQFFIVLNELYRNSPCLYENDYDRNSFNWIEAESKKECVYIYERKHENGQRYIVGVNMSNNFYKGYKVGIDQPAVLHEIINTDSLTYGGTGKDNGKSEIKTMESICKGHKYSYMIDLAPLSGMILECSYLYVGSGVM